MIPIHLKIAGIYSYREKQEIDFRTLTAAHLFGIFGPVGSGKSAILEAIMFALYGETERLNSREMRAYNMMNLKSNEAFIQFDFIAPGDKGEYRALVKGKRNSKNKEDVKFERVLYRVSGTDLIPADPAEITTILGISYDNFRRTIIIPQGKFQEFLQLGAKDRTDMVKELFNLHRFDLSFKTNRLQKKNDEAISNYEGQLQQLGDIREESITAKETELTGLSRELDLSRIKLKEKEAGEAEMQRISGLHAELAKNQVSLKELEAQKGEIQKAEQRLNDFDECVTNFKSDFDLSDNQKRQLETEELQFSKKQNELSLAIQMQKEVEERYAFARKAYESRELLLQQSKELGLIAQVNTDRKIAAEYAGRIENGEKLLKEALLNSESLKAKAKEFTVLQETLKSRLPDFTRLQKAKDWFAAAGLLKERVETQRQKEELLKIEFTSFRKELSAIAEKHNISVSKNENDFSFLLQQLDVKKEELRKSIQAVEKHLIHLEVQDKLKSLASEIEEGKPCPLCGSTEHPNVLTVDTVAKDLLNYRGQKAVNENQFDLLHGSASQAGKIWEQLKKKTPDLEVTQKALAEAGKALLNHEKSFSWTGLTEEKLREEMETFSKLHQEIEELSKQTNEALGKSEIESRKEKEFVTLLESLRIEQGKAIQNADTLQKQLSVTDFSKYSGTTAEILLEQAQSLKLQYNNAGKEYADAEKIRNGTSAEVQTLSGMVESMKLSIQALRINISTLQTQLRDRILSTRFGSELAVREILASQPDRVNEQKRIQRFREMLASVTAAVQQLERQLEGKLYDALVHQQLKQEISSLKTLQEEQNRQKGAAENILKNLKQALAVSIKLRSELETLATRRENLKTLADLFRGQSFVNFVSTLHLQNLVNSANDRFYRLTRQQLKLELDPENNFRIRDYLNEGQWRNVKTLSGGQTFQASLCLALALADNIQQLNQNGQNFFFLDEGFGTLDRESLELVFETLKTLRRENRIVGVISHVEDLQQELSAWLRITRDDDNGSRISRSWEETLPGE
jgi:DNA repair protein SbcC/Rad50